MDELFNKIGPQTSGIIWVSSNFKDSKSLVYDSIDYLSNGLLTQSLQNNSLTNHLILVSNNFHNNFFIYIFSDFDKAKYESFLNLLSKELKTENSILVIDEISLYQEILQFTPKDLRSFLHLYQ